MSPEQNKIAIKLALAEKYAHLSQIAGSLPKRRTFAHKSTRYARQAVQMQRDAKR